MSAFEVLKERVGERRELPPVAMRRALRLAAGITCKEIAVACGVTPEAVRLWELGLREPKGSNLSCYLQSIAILRDGGL